ncbi:hypothetical protein FPV67DRAFT_1671296 [Lyophyllum atratum]|nr:hypothetical protein FPV67DRAFT_1671296 [Lyophyllum atratum]
MEVTFPRQDRTNSRAKPTRRVDRKTVAQAGGDTDAGTHPHCAEKPDHLAVAASVPRTLVHMRDFIHGWTDEARTMPLVFDYQFPTGSQAGTEQRTTSTRLCGFGRRTLRHTPHVSFTSSLSFFVPWLVDSPPPPVLASTSTIHGARPALLTPPHVTTQRDGLHLLSNLLGSLRTPSPDNEKFWEKIEEQGTPTLQSFVTTVHHALQSNFPLHPLPDLTRTLLSSPAPGSFVNAEIVSPHGSRQGHFFLTPSFN